METKLWQKKTFSESNVPEWVCPKCHRGNLELDKTKFSYEETESSKEERNDENWEIESINFSFNGFLRCVNTHCKEIVSFIGTGGVEFIGYYDEEDSHKNGYYNFFEPRYFFPALHIFKIYEKCPPTIRAEIVSAFGLFWADLGSCANKIRVAIELLMDDQGIKKYPMKGRRKSIPLHDRIKFFTEKQPEIGAHLQAVKWIGNSGSHVGRIERVDVLDAFELLEFCIEKLYDDREERLKKVSKEINKRRGARKKVPIRVRKKNSSK